MPEQALKFLDKHGPWAALTAVLIGVMLWEVRPSLASMRAEHQEMRAEDAAQDQRIQSVMGQVLMAIERSNYLERRNCINTARTVADREACAKDKD